MRFLDLCRRLKGAIPSLRYISPALRSDGFSTRLRQPISCLPSTPLFLLCHRREFSSKTKIDMTKFPPEKIRNFCITAHIDHGKTTLSTRLLENSGTIRATSQNELYLDKLNVEKERGITVKAQTASMFYRHEDNGETYLLNLIDTPGHVDFNYEVSRSMKACEGALLLVDAVKGVQAQTLANWWLAVQNNLEIVPIINKIDLISAQPAVIAQQLASTFGMDPEKVIKISALSGYGVESIFPAIVKLIPSPNASSSRPFRALLFDSWYADVHAGVMCLIKIAEGSVKVGDKIQAGSTRQNYEVQEIGIMHPEPIPTDCLFAGQVGYVKLGMKTTKEARVGDTFYHFQRDNSVPVELFSGFKPAKAMVFAGIYPEENGEFDGLRDAIEKLTLNDPSVTVERDHNDVLGMGYRCGFLGLLHMDVFLQRLREEHNTTVIATAPNIPVRFKMLDDSFIEITTASKFPASASYTAAYEPFVKATIFTPAEFVGQIIQLCFDRRGEQTLLSYLDETRVHLEFKMPLSEIIFDFFDKLKQVSSGHATLDYEELEDYVKSDVVKVSIFLNGQPAEPLSVIAHRSKAEYLGKLLTSKLKEVIPRQMFEIRVQASIGTKIIARETIKPFRKDVTAKCYGGDITRKRKLLDKQKEGKKKMKAIGNVELDQDAFLAVTKLTEPSNNNNNNSK